LLSGPEAEGQIEYHAPMEGEMAYGRLRDWESRVWIYPLRDE